MRILTVCQNYWPEPFNVHEMCEGLAARGHEVTVLTGLPNYPDGVVPEGYRRGRNRSQRRGGVDIVRVPVVPRGADLRGANLAKRMLNYASFALAGTAGARRLSGFDAVLAFEFSPITMVLPATSAARRLGIPLLMYVVDLWPEDALAGGIGRDGPVFRLLARLSARLYGRADALAVTSPDFEGYISGRLGVSGKPFVYLPQFAEDMFARGDPSPARRGDGEFRVVFAGNVGANQALDCAVRAVAMLPRESPVRLHVYGEGSRLGECRSLAEELGAGDRVAFLGRRPLAEMPEVYRGADAMLLTLADPENGSLVPLYTIPRKLQSYMAAGRPVVACASGVAGRLVGEAACGASCEAGDAEGLARALSGLASAGPEALAAMGRNARSYYEGRFSKERFFATLEFALEDLVSKGKRA